MCLICGNYPSYLLANSHLGAGMWRRFEKPSRVDLIAAANDSLGAQRC